jgi:hypothetical protein
MCAARVIGHALTALGRLERTPVSLIDEALRAAVTASGLNLRDLDGLVAMPSLSDPQFMMGHHVATAMGLMGHQNHGSSFCARTIDVGGAGPVAGLLQAVHMVEREGCHAVALVGGDAVCSMATADFLRRADEGTAAADKTRCDEADWVALPSPRAGLMAGLQSWWPARRCCRPAVWVTASRYWVVAKLADPYGRQRRT